MDYCVPGNLARKKICTTLRWLSVCTLVPSSPVNYSNSICKHSRHWDMSYCDYIHWYSVQNEQKELLCVLKCDKRLFWLQKQNGCTNQQNTELIKQKHSTDHHDAKNVFFCVQRLDTSTGLSLPAEKSHQENESFALKRLKESERQKFWCPSSDPFSFKGGSLGPGSDCCWFCKLGPTQFLPRILNARMAIKQRGFFGGIMHQHSVFIWK